VGIVCQSFARVDEAVAEMVAKLDHYRAATGRVRNRALFEVPEILQRILADADGAFSPALPAVPSARYRPGPWRRPGARLRGRP
jgi:predicted ATPase